MKTNGWTGEPINVILMPDGGLTAIDNTRLLAARKAGINAEIIIHEYNSKMPASKARQYTVMGKSEPQTWGEAIHARINNQNYTYFQDRIFTNKFPNGSVYDPKITGKGPKL